MKKAQALLELAIFGSILLMLLGVLINYGLRYNYQQRLMQTAFRHALVAADEASQPGKPDSVSYLYVEDRHIANPQDAWAFGSVIPIMAEATVTRNPQSTSVADKKRELPRTIINIQGQEVANLKTAGFGEAGNVIYKPKKPKGEYDQLDKYREIYGNTVDRCKNYDEVKKECVDDKWVDIEDDYAGECLEPDLNDPNGQACLKWGIKRIRFIDPCAGNIMNYESAVKQCRQIIDSEACTSECERGQPKDSEVKCKKLCAQTIETPWYCQGAKPRQDGFHRYNFPVLNKIFDFAKKNETNKKVMGLQPNYTQGTIAVNTSHKQESKPTEKEPASIIKTTDAASWTVTTHRIIIDRPYDDFSGETKETPVKSTVSQKTDTTWETKWGK